MFRITAFVFLVLRALLLIDIPLPTPKTNNLGLYKLAALHLLSWSFESLLFAVALAWGGYRGIPLPMLELLCLA